MSTKHILDTSILFESISQDGSTVRDVLNRNNVTRRYHLYHCLIEFRLGLLYNWIGFYLDVLATQDIKNAKRRLARIINFRPRQGSNYVLLEALLAELHKSLEVGKVDIYLAQVEECINYAQTSIELLSSKVVGSNGHHHLLKPSLITPEDYEDFFRRCKEDYVVDLTTLFTTRSQRFKELLEYLKSLELKGEKKKRADRIIGLVEQGLAEVSVVNSKSKNRRYGDIAIAMDSPKDYHILSSDTAFELLCTGLNKNFVNYADLDTQRQEAKT